MKKENRKGITTPKQYWFSLYSVATGSQYGYSCLAKDKEQAFRKMRKDNDKYTDVADYGTY